MNDESSIKKPEDPTETEYYFGGLKVKKIAIAEAVFAIAQSPITCGSSCGCFAGPFGPFPGPFGP